MQTHTANVCRCSHCGRWGRHRILSLSEPYFDEARREWLQNAIMELHPVDCPCGTAPRLFLYPDEFDKNISQFAVETVDNSQ